MVDVGIEMQFCAICAVGFMLTMCAIRDFMVGVYGVGFIQSDLDSGFLYVHCVVRSAEFMHPMSILRHYTVGFILLHMPSDETMQLGFGAVGV